MTSAPIRVIRGKMDRGLGNLETELTAAPVKRNGVLTSKGLRLISVMI